MAKNTEDYQLKEGSEYASDESFDSPTNPQRAASAGGAIGSMRPGAPFNFPIKNKKVVVIIGFFVVLFFIMQVVKLFSSGSKSTIQDQQITSESNQKTDIQASGIRSLNEKYSVVEANIQQLQKDMDEAKTNVVEMNKSLYDLNITVQQLTAEVQKIIAEKVAIKKTMSGKKTPYHIRAIVNGRAWLETDNGIDTITVRAGSNLGKYGKVEEVDDKNGIVTTDKGAVIRHGKNDL